MSSARRLAASLYLHSGESWTTRAYSKSIYIGEPSTASRIFSELGAHEVFIQTRDSVGDAVTLGTLEIISKVTFIPLTYSGGIASAEDAISVTRLGYEKVAVETLLLSEPKIISDVSRELGASSTIASFSFVDRKLWSWKTGVKFSWKEALKLIDLAQVLGAGEVKLNAVRLDGSREGPDFDLIRELAPRVHVPLIYQGGIRDVKDVENLWDLGVDCVSSSTWLSSVRPYDAALLSFPESLSVNHT